MSVASSRTKEEVFVQPKGEAGPRSADKTSFQFVAFHRKLFNVLKDMVGAPGFEPGASCAQGKR